MVNIGYHTARVQGQTIRSMYHAALPWIVKLPIEPPRAIPIAVYAFSCERDLPEQVASIRSFIRCVGLPDSFTVVSDGSYSAESHRLLRRISPCVDVVEPESILKKDLPECVLDFAHSAPWGKKLAVAISIPVDKVTIFTDSDILFFPGAEELAAVAMSDDQQPRYLLDCLPSLDERILLNISEKSNPVNSGFMILKHPLDWEMALVRFSQFKKIPIPHTEQTLIHLAMQQSQALPLCPERFIVRDDDQFIYPDMYANKRIAIRHYVTPVRHKFWLNVGI